MGIFRQFKVETLSAEAAKAHEAGQVRYVCQLNRPVTQHVMSGEIPDWSQAIEAIERAGWLLEHWSVSSDVKGRPEAYAVFRRRK